VDADAERARALAAYKTFLDLWKDAEPGMPLYKEATAENAKLLDSAGWKDSPLAQCLPVAKKECHKPAQEAVKESVLG
jgi:hypothetical protein